MLDWKSIFKSFLEENNLLKIFISEIGKHQGEVVKYSNHSTLLDNYLDQFTYIPEAFINLAFPYEETFNGHEYWRKINFMWLEKIEQITREVSGDYF